MTGPPVAGLARRLASAVYDALLLSALLVVAGFVLLPWVSPGVPAGPRTAYELGNWQRAGSFVWLLAAAGTYCVGFWSGGRRTLPMRTWRLQLVTRSGSEVSPGRALARFAASLLGPAAAIAAYAALSPLGQGAWAAAGLLLNFAWALVDPERAFLHDRLAGTRLRAAATKPPPAQSSTSPPGLAR